MNWFITISNNIYYAREGIRVVSSHGFPLLLDRAGVGGMTTSAAWGQVTISVGSGIVHKHANQAEEENDPEDA